jgi:Fic family protein
MKPFVPDKLPLDSIDWIAHISNIGKANASLARYDGLLHSIVNPNLLLSPLTTQEAVLSSKIEGTLATLDEVFEYEASPSQGFSSTRINDILEIHNYTQAIDYAVIKLKAYPLTLNVIREIHAILLDSVRGNNKAPGEFRRIQNYIGVHGASIENAAYIPPSPEIMITALDKWEKYIHFAEKDPIVQLAIVKAQFEIIHPFLDGNGRIGRILIPLFLYHKGVLSRPMFYLSSYLESNRDEYYRRLKAISDKGDWNGWIKFFLEAVHQQAEINTKKVKLMLDLYEKMKTELPKLIRSQYTMQAIDTLFKNPYVTGTGFIKNSGILRDSAHRILNTLVENGVLTEIRKPTGRKSVMFIFNELLEIVR